MPSTTHRYDIEVIKAETDLVALIGKQVSLKRAGRDYVGLCPLHTEKTPSFYVMPAKRLWHCFGCGRSGDCFDWVCETEGCDFAEAARKLGGKLTLTVRQLKEQQAQQQRDAAATREAWRELHPWECLQAAWEEERADRAVAETRAMVRGTGAWLDVWPRTKLWIAYQLGEI